MDCTGSLDKTHKHARESCNKVNDREQPVRQMLRLHEIAFHLKFCYIRKSSAYCPSAHKYIHSSVSSQHNNIKLFFFDPLIGSYLNLQESWS